MRNYLWIYYNTWRFVDYMVKHNERDPNFISSVQTDKCLHRNQKLSDLLDIYLKLLLVWKYTGQT